jgi:hypothetical protein
MDTVEIFCIDNEKTRLAEVLSKSDKYLKVVLKGTQITLELSRKDLNKLYIGRTAGLEFSYNDKR